MDERENINDDLAGQLMGPLEQLLERVGVDTVFGTPRRKGDVTIIPVAESIFGMGFGFGSGSGPGPAEIAKPGTVVVAGAEGQDLESDEAEDDESAEPDGEDSASKGEGSGAGGGGGGRTRPVGYIRITEDGVGFEPVMDQSRIALAGMLLGGWSILWGALVLRSLFSAVSRGRSAAPELPLEEALAELVDEA